MLYLFTIHVFIHLLEKLLLSTIQYVLGQTILYAFGHTAFLVGISFSVSCLAFAYLTF